MKITKYFMKILVFGMGYLHVGLDIRKRVSNEKTMTTQ